MVAETSKSYLARRIAMFLALQPETLSGNCLPKKLLAKQHHRYKASKLTSTLKVIMHNSVVSQVGEWNSALSQLSFVTTAPVQTHPTDLAAVLSD